MTPVDLDAVRKLAELVEPIATEAVEACWQDGAHLYVSLIQETRAMADEIEALRKEVEWRRTSMACPHNVSLDSLPPFCGTCGEVNPWGKSRLHGEIEALREVAKAARANALTPTTATFSAMIAALKKAGM